MQVQGLLGLDKEEAGSGFGPDLLNDCREQQRKGGSEKLDNHQGGIAYTSLPPRLPAHISMHQWETASFSLKLTLLYTAKNIEALFRCAESL